ncbi:MAG: hypothetical protein QM754_04040 [Tepidisphaeraceae bacterium]
MEFDDGRHFPAQPRRLHELRVHASTFDAREIKMEALGERHFEVRGDEFHLRIDGLHLGDRPVPIRIKIRRPGIAAFVSLELVQRHVDLGHDGNVEELGARS